MKRLVLVAAVALGVAGAAHAAPDPTRVPTSFTGVVRTTVGVERVAWSEPAGFAVRALGGVPTFGRLTETAARRVYRWDAGSPASVFTRPFLVPPDGYAGVDRLAGPSATVLAKARAGTLRLRPATVHGRAALTAKLHLPQNDCAALPAGHEQVWLGRATLLPLRLEERRAGRLTSSLSLELRTVNAGVPHRAFAPPRTGPHPYRRDEGFRRASPAAAASHLPYAPVVATWLPAGFELAVSGWAPRTAVTGPEGSIPAMRDLFAAQYRRGFEHVDVTQRRAPGKGGWPADPFGGECARLYESPAKVGDAEARYAAGPTIAPHLTWAADGVLYTVSGPFPKATLVRIAESLAPPGS